MQRIHILHNYRSVSAWSVNRGATESDFVVKGCVAVDPDGNRLGKGGGYGDRGIAEARRLDDKVKVAVTCHSIQVMPYVPRSELDLPVDYIATELSLYRCD